MSQTPPTSPGSLPPAVSSRVNVIMLGSFVHAMVVLITCFAVPLAMDSNIWPIAGVFWSALTVPVAAVTGALTGWLSKRLRFAIAVPVMVVTGVLVAIAAGIIMANNR